MQEKYVIIGGNGAGMSAASKIKRLSPDADLVVLEKSAHMSVAACGIPYWIAGKVDEQKLQVLTPQKARDKRGIDVRVLHEVTEINSLKKIVAVKNLSNDTSEILPYDKLLIATGARAAIPPIPGIDNKGIFTLRSLRDGHDIQEYSKSDNVRHITIIGAGFIGLEMAEAFRRRNFNVAVVELEDQIAPAFDKDIVEKVESHLIDNGLELHLQTMVNSFESNANGLQVNTSTGKIATDMVIVSTGVRPNSELAEKAGIKLGNGGAIAINSQMQTSKPDIYSAGDCAEHFHRVLDRNVWIPLAPSANKGGRIAGANMTGEMNHFPGILGTAVVKVFDYIIAKTGISEKQARASDTFPDIKTSIVTAGSLPHYYPGSAPVTIKLIVEEPSNRLLGAQMIGTSDIAKRTDVFATAIAAKMTIDEVAMLDLTYAPPVAPVYDPIHIAANVATR